MFYGVRFILQNPKIYYYKINKTNNDTADNKPGHKRKTTLQNQSKTNKNHERADEETFCGEEFKMTTLIITLAVFAAVTGIADHIYELNMPQMEELPDLR